MDRHNKIVVKLFALTTLDMTIDSIRAFLRMKNREGERSPIVISSEIKFVELKQGQVTLMFQFDCVVNSHPA